MGFWNKSKKESDKDKRKGSDKEDKNEGKSSSKDSRNDKSRDEKAKMKKQLIEKQKRRLPPHKRAEEKAPPNFSKNIHDAFTPYRWLLYAFGRLPISFRIKPDGTYLYICTLFSFTGVYFLLSSLLICLIFLVGSFNVFCLVTTNSATTLGFTVNETVDNNSTTPLSTVTSTTPSPNGTTPTPSEPPNRLCSREIKDVSKDSPLHRIIDLREAALFKRHFVTFIVIWSALILCIIGSLNLFFKRKYLINFLNFWSRAVHTMHMDVAKGLHCYSLISGGVYLVTILTLLILGLCEVGPSTAGSSTLMALFIFRQARPDLLGTPGNSINKPYEIQDDLAGFQVMSGLFILFIYVASRAYIFMFLFHCKLLQNAFAAWNGRVYAAVLRGGDYTQTPEGRTTFSLLFKDHCVLLDLLEGTDQFFTSIIESYFGFQVASICFETFFLLRVTKEGTNQESAFTSGFFVRKYDWAPALVILVQSIVLLWVVSKAAAAVGEEAMAGLEVIRRKTMLGRKTDEELYFSLSMYSSYTAYKKLEISGGGYFYLNKEFIIGVISTVFSYFIIIYQFNPILDLELPGKGVDEIGLDSRKAIGRFLEKIEHVECCHWEEFTTPNCTSTCVSD